MTWKMTNRNQYLNVSGKEDWRLCRMFTSKAPKFSLVSKPSLLSTGNHTTLANKFHIEREKNILAGSKFVSKTVPQCNWTLTDLFSGTISLRYLIGSYVFLLFICKSQCFEILAFYFLVFALFSSFCSVFTKTCIALSQSVSRIFSCILLRQLHVPAH